MNIFTYENTDLRTIEIEGATWFHAADVCKCVGLNTRNGTNNHLRKVDRDEKQLITPHRMRGLRGPGAMVVNESGLYRLVMRADGAKSKPFRDWVVKEVLPAIRKTGGYLLNEEARENAHADTKQQMPLPAECCC